MHNEVSAKDPRSCLRIPKGRRKSFRSCLRNGQITLEAIFIFGIFMLIFIGVSVPLAFKVKSAADDVSVVSDAGYAVVQIVAASQGVTVPGAKRTVNVYVPGYSSRARTLTTTLSTDGYNITATVSGMSDGNKLITRSLYGSGWRIYNGSTGAEAPLNESAGRRYNFEITWSGSIKNITYS